MKVTRVYTGKDGESHFEEIEVNIGKLQAADGIVFRHASPGEVNDWHVAPRRQYVINLSGHSEVEIGDGTKLHFGPRRYLSGRRHDGTGPYIVRDRYATARLCDSCNKIGSTVVREQSGPVINETIQVHSLASFMANHWVETVASDAHLSHKR